MKNFFAALVVLALLASCGNDKKRAVVPEDGTVAIAIDSTLVTDTSWGPIQKNANNASLLTAYSNANVKDERICGPECVDSIDVTKIYPGTNKEFVIYWKDSLYHKAISFIEAREEGSPYHTASGLKIGSSLQDILAENGKPVTFAGFSWDYGGYIHSFQNGKLEKSNVGFRLDIGETNDNSLLGDTELNTDMPSVKKMLDKIKVYTLSLSFNKGE